VTTRQEKQAPSMNQLKRFDIRHNRHWYTPHTRIWCHSSFGKKKKKKNQDIKKKKKEKEKQKTKKKIGCHSSFGKKKKKKLKCENAT